MWDYSEKVMNLFYHPHNIGAIAPDECKAGETIAIGEVGSVACGDALRLYLKIDRETDTILDARFQTFGCASAIASSSALTDLVKGMKVDDALKISNRDIANYLDGLPQEKMHCSVMGQEALEAAIANYKGVSIRQDEDDDSSLVCKCFAVSQGQIKRVIRENHLTTAEEVTNYIKAGGGCGSCLADIDDLLAEVNEQTQQIEASFTRSPSLSKTSASVPLTNLQKISLIQEILDKEVRPFLATDGGDVELYDVEGNRVLVMLKGACDGCPSVTATLKMGIEAKLQERVSPDLVVEAIL
ncbi:MAG: Fe-S cluster assembly protein NifU [Hydrococcus sp. C42_A2020_068]|nr:Fe-S cluster assembly protein NifU [Hydrococcus sp. C42_A2020_068]